MAQKHRANGRFDDKNKSGRKAELLRRTLASRSRRLSLCGVCSPCAKLLRGSGLDEEVDFYSTRAEALASIDREAV